MANGLRQLRTTSVVWMLLSVAAIAFAQGPEPQSAIDPPPEVDLSGASLRGKVTDATTLQPIGNLAIGLKSTSGIALAWQTKTSADGTFSIPNLATGEYTLTIGGLRTGYARHSQTVVLKTFGETSLDMKLSPAMSLRGRVITQGGAPVVKAKVTARAIGYVRSRPWLLESRSATSGEGGEFVLDNVTTDVPFVVRISPTDPKIEATPKATPEGLLRWKEQPPRKVHSLIYYPNSLTREGALPLRVDGNAAPPYLELVVPEASAWCVRGGFASARADVTTGTVQLMLFEPAVQSQFVLTTGAVSLSGDFEICGLLPGEYQLVAVDFADRELRANAAQRFVLGDRHEQLKDLVLGPRFELKGTVRCEPEACEADALSGVVVEVYPSGRISVMGDGAGAILSNGRTFELTGKVFADDYEVDVARLPERLYVTSVLLGGDEIWGRRFQARPDELTVTLRQDGPVLRGTVVDRDANLQPDRVVVLVAPTFPALLPGQARAGRTSGDGRFNLSGFPPAEYIVYVAEEIDPSRALLQDNIRRRLAKGGLKKIRLEPGDEISLTLETQE
ncbi:MAG: carboxypeptidase regulatory-like domain-containing protein [Bryobacterales bacterium]|nr:carboxypeptidase regulatory-like domain-containing protein [Bryobacterales bacterium]